MIRIAQLPQPTKPLNVIAVSRGNDQYLFRFDLHPESRKRLAQVVCEFASDKRLNFTWLDAGLVRLAVAELTAAKQTS